MERTAAGPLILNVDTMWSSVISFRLRQLYLRGRTPVPVEYYSTGWAPASVWSFWRGEISAAATAILALFLCRSWRFAPNSTYSGCFLWFVILQTCNVMKRCVGNKERWVAFNQFWNSTCWVSFPVLSWINVHISRLAGTIINKSAAIRFKFLLKTNSQKLLHGKND